MASKLRSFAQNSIRDTNVYRQVESIATDLLQHLNLPEVQALIDEANQPGMNSALVHKTFLRFARELGFRDERRGLFQSYHTKGLRPDYFRPIGDTGILLEVERGKTTINNMDLLDFWKCHICEHAHYLFLLVPIELRQNSTMSPRREFAKVEKRLAAFFDRPENYTNVHGLFLFGY